MMGSMDVIQHVWMPFCSPFSLASFLFVLFELKFRSTLDLHDVGARLTSSSFFLPHFPSCIYPCGTTLQRTQQPQDTNTLILGLQLKCLFLSPAIYHVCAASVLQFAWVLQSHLCHCSSCAFSLLVIFCLFVFFPFSSGTWKATWASPISPTRCTGSPSRGGSSSH